MFQVVKYDTVSKQWSLEDEYLFLLGSGNGNPYHMDAVRVPEGFIKC